MLTVACEEISTNPYQQIVKQDYYQYQENNPEDGGYWQKGNLFLPLLLVENHIIVQFSSCHGYHFHNSTSRIGECTALENK